MKKISKYFQVLFVICWFLILGTNFSIAQDSTSFYKVYTGGLFDYGQGITQLDNGKYAITGSTSSLDDNTSKTLLMVIDAEGSHEWTKGYGGSNSNWGRRVFHETGEGFWIAGYSNSFGDESFDFTLTKTDENGVLEWENNYGTSDRERLWDAIRLDDGSFVLVGETEGFLSEGKDILMYKIDENGNELWETQIQNEGDDIGYALTHYDDTSFLVCGEYYDNGAKSGIILKMHKDGSFIEQWLYDQDGPASFRDIKRFDDQTYVVGGVNALSEEFLNSVLLRLDNDYNILDSDVITNSNQGDAYVTSFEITADNKLYWTLKTNAPYYNVYPGGFDAFIYRYHRAQFFLGPSISISGVNDDELTQTAATADGGFIFVGSCSDDRSNLSNGSDLMVFKIGPNDEYQHDPDLGNDLLDIEEYNTSNQKHLYPNPTEGILYIPEELSYKDIKIVNALGETQEISINNDKINISNLSSGVYFVIVNNEQKTHTYRVAKE
ncbi:MAG: T9SS type A sorting domain-containing protein [Brumimicrobium sp.]